MTSHLAKMMAPLMIVLVFISYYITLAWTMINFDFSILIKIVIVLGSIAVSLMLIWVLIDSIKEIRKGEEDDLSKY